MYTRRKRPSGRATIRIAFLLVVAYLVASRFSRQAPSTKHETALDPPPSPAPETTPNFKTSPPTTHDRRRSGIRPTEHFLRANHYARQTTLTIASYNNADALRATLRSLEPHRAVFHSVIVLLANASDDGVRTATLHPIVDTIAFADAPTKPVVPKSGVNATEGTMIDAKTLSAREKNARTLLRSVHTSHWLYAEDDCDWTGSVAEFVLDSMSLLESRPELSRVVGRHPDGHKTDDDVGERGDSTWAEFEFGFPGFEGAPFLALTADALDDAAGESGNDGDGDVATFRTTYCRRKQV